MYDAPCTREDVVDLLASDDNNIPGGMLKTSAFRDFAADAQLRSCPVDLEVGDMYFFKSDSLHEVPGFTGDLARVVQATFIGCVGNTARPPLYQISLSLSLSGLAFLSLLVL